MKNLSIAFLAAVSLVSFAGCKKHGGAGEAISKMSEFKDAMCKCADKACVDKVTADMTKWGQDAAKAGADKAEKISEEDTKKMAAVTEEMTKCMTKAMMPPAAGDMKAAPAGDKPADPAAGSAAAPAGDKPADPAAGSAAAPAAGSAAGSN